jgi:MoxR-like ATPase
VLGPDEVLRHQASVREVHVDRSIVEYVVAIVQATRVAPEIALGASPRSMVALTRCAQARAVAEGRDFVLPDDVKAMAVPALAHRLILKPELWAARISATQVVESLLEQVPAPGPESR